MSKEMSRGHMPDPWLVAEARVVHEGLHKEPSRLQHFFGNRIYELGLHPRPYKDICGVANAMVQMAKPDGVPNSKSIHHIIMAQAIMEIYKGTVPVMIRQLAGKVCEKEPILERYFRHDDMWDEKSLATSLGLVHAIGPYLGDFSAFDKQLPSGIEAQKIYFRRSALSLMIDPQQMQRDWNTVYQYGDLNTVYKYGDLNTVYKYGAPTIAEYMQHEYSGVLGALTISMRPTQGGYGDTLAALERSYVNGWQISQRIMSMLGCNETQFASGKGTDSFHNVVDPQNVRRMLHDDIAAYFKDFYNGVFPLLEIEMYRVVPGYHDLRPVDRQLLDTAQLHGVRDHVHCVGTNSGLRWLTKI